MDFEHNLGPLKLPGSTAVLLISGVVLKSGLGV